MKVMAFENIVGKGESTGQKPIIFSASFWINSVLLAAFNLSSAITFCLNLSKHLVFVVRL